MVSQPTGKSMAVCVLVQYPLDVRFKFTIALPFVSSFFFFPSRTKVVVPELVPSDCTSCRDVPCCAVSCSAMQCHAVPWCGLYSVAIHQYAVDFEHIAMLRYATLRDAMLDTPLSDGFSKALQPSPQPTGIPRTLMTLCAILWQRSAAQTQSPANANRPSCSSSRRCRPGCK